MNKKLPPRRSKKGAKAVFLIVDSTRFNKVNPTVFYKASVYAEQLSNKYPIPVIRINEQAFSRMFSKKSLKDSSSQSKVYKGKSFIHYILSENSTLIYPYRPLS